VPRGFRYPFKSQHGLDMYYRSRRFLLARTTLRHALEVFDSTQLSSCCRDKVDPVVGEATSPNAATLLLQSAGWYADCDPRARTQTRVTLDSGQDGSVPAAAHAILAIAAAATNCRWLRGTSASAAACLNEVDGAVGL
jgi:hypothetical protein